jgi:hypothetical protein
MNTLRQLQELGCGFTFTADPLSPDMSEGFQSPPQVIKAFNLYYKPYTINRIVSGQ